jgi:hypothetical protein
MLIVFVVQLAYAASDVSKSAAPMISFFMIVSLKLVFPTTDCRAICRNNVSARYAGFRHMQAYWR